MRKPYAKALCTRVLLKDISTREGRPPGAPQRGGGALRAAPSGRRPPVDESLVDILEEDLGAQCFRIGLAHRAGAYPAAAPGAICCHIVLDVAPFGGFWGQNWLLITCFAAITHQGGNGQLKRLTSPEPYN